MSGMLATNIVRQYRPRSSGLEVVDVKHTDHLRDLDRLGHINGPVVEALQSIYGVADEGRVNGVMARYGGFSRAAARPGRAAL